MHRTMKKEKMLLNWFPFLIEYDAMQLLVDCSHQIESEICGV